MAKRIVIVEDDPDQRDNYIDAISKKGYEVRAFASRTEALAGFDLELPDLVILDIILGDEVAHRFVINISVKELIEMMALDGIGSRGIGK